MSKKNIFDSSASMSLINKKTGEYIYKDVKCSVKDGIVKDLDDNTELLEFKYDQEV